ncbi:HYC_CC_PP family protein [Abyssalbus ytuae]|uniref:Secreted protein n=1 Tax=Abyssalbus ytuae TaxID=2926907 RepID=A0A9E6ZPP9_9FLAO|nr:hypothetical protein [Abyssalbus ytuae]UOB16488.1 hypothetical protein MQE35_12160 [Abyssalbus ytuae]
MKKLLLKISAVLMTLVILSSTMSFTINRHYCGDILVDTAIFKEAKSCGMEMKTSMNASKECSVTKKSCCSDEQLVIQGQDELKTSVESFSVSNQLFLASFVYSYTSLFEESKESTTSYNDYTPPLVVRSIYKLDETYLI